MKRNERAIVAAQAGIRPTQTNQTPLTRLTYAMPMTSNAPQLTRLVEAMQTKGQ